MSDMKISPFLAEVIQHAKRIGADQSTVFTAERFILAILDMAARTPEQEKSEEMKETESILNRAASNLPQTRGILIEYVTAENNAVFLDDLYMKKRLQEAQKAAESSDSKIITAALLLGYIIKEPSDAIRRAFGISAPKKVEEGVPEDILERFLPRKAEGLTDATEPAKAEDAQPPAKSPEEEVASAKGALTDLVSDVKRIRKVLGESVLGQDNAINTFATGYFQANMLSMIDKSRTRPRATFLFAGPPGVGKTFLAEQAAQALGLPFMRFDMSEYTDEQTAAQEICGYPRTYKEHKPGKATAFVDKNPKCILLFDEIEKCCTEVIHLFLQLLDAGILRDACMEKTVSFKDTIIIMTTNAGRQLYEDDSIADLSSVSRKVVLRALQKDVNPRTGIPYFPAAICSRFASGNVVMFNHMSAGVLQNIAQKEIRRHAANLHQQTGIDLQVEEKVYTALLYSEGASVDARTIRARAETFFNDELFELFRLVASDKVKTDISDIETVQVSVNLEQTRPDLVSLFEFSETPRILVFAEEDIVSICRDKLTAYHVSGTKDIATAVETLKSDDVDLVLLDMRCGADAGALSSLNIEDVDSPARDFYHFILEHRNGLPVYLLEGHGTHLTDEEKITFMRQGVRGVLRVTEEQDDFASSVEDIAVSLYQQACLSRLAKENKLVSFETAQVVSEDGKNAEIKLFDFSTKVAVDSEDNKNILGAVSKPNVMFADVIGAQDAKTELTYFVEYLKNPRKYTGTGVKAPKGVLLYGPPGTGKTMLAKAMAKESDVTFIAAEGNQFLKQYVGEGPAKVHELFRIARKYAPSILFIDEIDAIGKERRGAESSSGGVEETLTAFLAEMDGFANDTSKPVFVLAATNFDVEPGGPKSLDPALMRRFDRRIYIELPGKEDRTRFMTMKIQKNPAFDITKEQIDNLAMRSTGMSLAELDSAMELSLRSAIRSGSTKVTNAILEEAFETFNNGETKKWDASQLQRVARHEAGHAFVCWYHGETPSYLTVVARGNHGGYMQHADREGKAVYTKDELLHRVKTSLGGRAAEIVYYGDKDGISTGASSDLVSATRVATQIICTYGMDREFGLAVVAERAAADGAVSMEVRTAVNRILEEQMAETVRIITDNKDKIDALVEVLLVKNHMNGAEIQEILAKNREQETNKVTDAE